MVGKWQEHNYMEETSMHVKRLEHILNGPSGEYTFWKSNQKIK